MFFNNKVENEKEGFDGGGGYFKKVNVEYFLIRLDLYLYLIK